MTSPAAAIELATATAAVAAFANCTATVGGVSISGIFDDAYLDPLGISGSQPALICVSEDIFTVVQGAAVVVNSVNYMVREVKPDGTGMTMLELEKSDYTTWDLGTTTWDGGATTWY